jgi:flagellar basal-body rod protein FlgF
LHFAASHCPVTLNSGGHFPAVRGTPIAIKSGGGTGMLKGIHKAASGMIPRVKQQEITANNIANASTAGYKKDSIFLQELNAARRASLPRKSDWEQPMIDQVYTDYSQGTFERTGNSLDVAINGEGFFILESPEGESRIYTRNGSFSTDLDGFMVNSEGFRVLGDGGPIEIGNGAVTVSETGDVLADDNQVGRIQVVEFADESVLVKKGTSGFAADDGIEPTPSANYTVRQGFLERANINVIKEMVRMIITLRNYETSSKAIQMQNDSLNVLFNQVGRTRM